MSSLPLRVTGFWCPRSFVVGVLSVDLGLHCCVYAPSRTVGRHHCVYVESVFLVSSHRLLVLWVSFGSFVVHIGFLGLESCGEF